MAVNIASLLADFSSSAGGEKSGMALLRSAKILPDTNPEPPAPVDRQAELLRSLEAKIRGEEREAARIRLEEAVAAEKSRCEDELNAQREIWAEQQAAQMSALILEALGRIEAMISERVANVLRPFVSEALRQQTLHELNEALAVLLFGDIAKLIKITGPEDLLAAMRAQLGLHEDVIEFVPGEQVEVSVTVQDTTIQTQLNAWSARLKKTLES
jgi:hypothetical protein